MIDRDNKINREVIVLIPAAGKATRIAPLPCSKELYPIGFQSLDGEHGKRPKVACQYLLEKMRSAGITNAYMVLREGKWDIPAYFRDGSLLDMNIAYLMMGLPFGVPYSIDQAHSFLRHATVAFGFPDILFQPDDAFVQLLNHRATSDVDILLGLFPGDLPETMDMVDVEENGRINEIVIKPRHSRLQYTWGIAVWTPAFSEFLHSYLTASVASPAPQPELSVGHVIRVAIRSGLRVEGVPISKEPYLDIGTPEGLAKAIKHFVAVERDESGE